MWRRLLQAIVRSYVKGPAQSWLYTSAAIGLFNFVRKRMGRSQTIDISALNPGDRIEIEHLTVTHKDQLKNKRKLRRQDRELARRVVKDKRRFGRS